MDELMNRIKYLITNPDKFFDYVRKETGILDSVLAFIGVSFIVAVIQILRVFSLYYGNITDPLARFLPIAVWQIGSIASTFVISGMIHLVVYIMKRKVSYEDTYKVYTYSILPFMLLNFVPLGSLSLLYSFYLMTIGFSKLHDISKPKALTAALAPVILVVILIGVLLFYVLMARILK